MEILERIWEIVSAIGNAILGRFERGVTSLFGSANARFLKRLAPKVEAINSLEPKYQAMICSSSGVLRSTSTYQRASVRISQFEDSRASPISRPIAVASTMPITATSSVLAMPTWKTRR